MNEKLETQLEQIMDQYPTLTFAGFDDRASSDDPEFLKDRGALRDDLDIAAAVCAWLKQFPKTKAMNNRVTSYGLKHSAEGALGRYVSNGQLIAAALIAGFQIKHDRRGGPNVWLNISKHVLDRGPSRVGAADVHKSQESKHV